MPPGPGPTLFDHLRELGRHLARALRTAAKRPTLTLVAVATLGIGIGASTATFSIADAVLMRPLPVHEQRQLSVLWGVDRAVGAQRVPVPYPAFKGFVDASPETLSAVAGVDYHGAATHPVREQGEGVNLKVAFVTGNLFNVLGVTPPLGRAIRAEDDSVAAAPVVAISYELWQRRYGANPSVLGRVLTIRGQAATIVAVMPRGFGFPAQTEGVGDGASVPAPSRRPARPTSMCTWWGVSRLARRSTSPRPNSRTTSRATSRYCPQRCAA